MAERCFNYEDELRYRFKLLFEKLSAVTSPFDLDERIICNTEYFIVTSYMYFVVSPELDILIKLVLYEFFMIRRVAS